MPACVETIIEHGLREVSCQKADGCWGEEFLKAVSNSADMRNCIERVKIQMAPCVGKR